MINSSAKYQFFEQIKDDDKKKIETFISHKDSKEENT
jgi:hypothetical protein